MEMSNLAIFKRSRCGYDKEAFSLGIAIQVTVVEEFD